ncbi:MAG: sensor histidine kinase [Spirochaetota bacterium]
MRAGIDDSRAVAYLALGLVLTVATAAGALVAANRVAESVKVQTAERFLSIAALLVADSPDAASQFADVLRGEPDPERVARGREILSRYGFQPEVVAELEPGLAAADRLPLVAAVSVLLAGGGTLGLAVVALRRTYGSVERLAAVASRIAEGSYRLEPEQETEGSLGRLTYQIRQTAHRLAEQAETANKGKESLRSFLSDVSHQMKTPLASVRMYHELLLEMEDGEAVRREEFLARSLSQIERMEWLVRNLLTEARMEAGALPVSLEPVPIGPTVQEAVSAFQARAADEKVSLTVTLPQADPPLSHDPRWLGEAVSNLVKNALDHTPEGGSVAVTVRHTAVFSRIVVTDTGPGIPLEELPRVFDRFYRGRQAASARSSGTGLGLALAKAIVERHGGAVSAASPGSGARFTITLPHLTKP